jgi:hypothetical protein
MGSPETSKDNSILSWIGVAGAAVTLLGLLDKSTNLSKWAHWLVENWSALNQLAWNTLLWFAPHFSSFDAGLLTFYLLVLLSLWRSRRVDSPRQATRFQRISLVVAISFIGFLFFRGLHDHYFVETEGAHICSLRAGSRVLTRAADAAEKRIMQSLQSLGKGISALDIDPSSIEKQPVEQEADASDTARESRTSNADDGGPGVPFYATDDCPMATKIGGFAKIAERVRITVKHFSRYRSCGTNPVAQAGAGVIGHPSFQEAFDELKGASLFECKTSDIAWIAKISSIATEIIFTLVTVGAMVLLFSLAWIKKLKISLPMLARRLWMTLLFLSVILGVDLIASILENWLRTNQIKLPS